ncbi:MAG: glycosyltransferase family 9 protein, partial [Candidatus Omnitrophota bacterium]
STPLLRNIRNNFPGVKIYYLCSKRIAPLIKIHPLISKIFVYERDDFVRESKKSFFSGLLKYWRFINEMRKEKIDCALDLSLNTQFSFFTLLAGIKKRYGLDYKQRCIFLTKKVEITGFNGKHVADYYLEVLKMLNVPIRRCNLEVYTNSISDKWVEVFLKENNILDKQLVFGIAPCGGESFGQDNCLRRWPGEKFAQLIDKLVEAYDGRVFIFAGPKEKNDIMAIIDALKCKSKVFDFSEFSLERTVSLVKRCNLFIGNDSGLLKFADGLDKKIVALYGPIDEKVYGPYMSDGRSIVVKKDLSCRPCYNNFRLKSCDRDRECLKSISVGEVFEAVGRLLRKI